MVGREFMAKQNGFSLVELLIVVVVISIIAAIAIPNLLVARKSANEGSAVASLRTIHGANATYQATTGAGNFAIGLVDLGTATLIDPVLAQSNKSGYNFSDYVQEPRAVGVPATFALVARPNVISGVTATGTRNFGISTDGVLATEALDGTSAGTMDAVIGGAGVGCTFGAGYPIIGNL